MNLAPSQYTSSYVRWSSKSGEFLCDRHSLLDQARLQLNNSDGHEAFHKVDSHGGFKICLSEASTQQSIWKPDEDRHFVGRQYLFSVTKHDTFPLNRQYSLEYVLQPAQNISEEKTKYIYTNAMIMYNTAFQNPKHTTLKHIFINILKNIGHNFRENLYTEQKFYSIHFVHLSWIYRNLTM